MPQTCGLGLSVLGGGKVVAGAAGVVVAAVVEGGGAGVASGATFGGPEVTGEEPEVGYVNTNYRKIEIKKEGRKERKLKLQQF